MTDETIRNRFSLANISKKDEVWEDLQESIRDLAWMIDTLLPNSRPQSLALTKLEECLFWAGKAAEIKEVFNDPVD